MKRGLALARPVERESGEAAIHEALGPGMQLFLAGIEPRQDDRDRRPRHAARLAQPTRHRHVPVGKFDALDRRIEMRRAGGIAAQHGLVGALKFLRPIGEQVLAVVVVHRGTNERFRRSPAVALGFRFLAQRLVARAFLRPQAAPVLPPRHPRHQRTQIVRVDAGGLVAWNEVREDQIDLRVTLHRGAYLCCVRISTDNDPRTGITAPWRRLLPPLSTTWFLPGRYPGRNPPAIRAPARRRRRRCAPSRAPRPAPPAMRR